MIRIRMTIVGLTLVTPILSPAKAAGAPLDIPAFARKYGVSCSLCHAPAPRLTAFGENFAANGFEFAAGETPRDTIDTGDPLLRLQRNLPLAIRFDAYLQAGVPEPEDRAGYDLQLPWGIKLLSGGQIANKVSYYMYFFMSERGEVAGLEDAYLQFTDMFGSGFDLLVGQFQVSDPMFKRELRLEVEDYAVYRLRVGDVRADLTYDRGLVLARSVLGGDLTLMVVNGTGLEASNEFRLYDRDPYKNLFGHYSRDLGPLRLGAFGYFGIEEGENGLNNDIVMFGPDATLALGTIGELNVQWLWRSDDNPFYLADPPAEDVDVNGGFAEAILWPQGPAGRLFFTALYNQVESDVPAFRVRLGEQELLDTYRFGALGANYLLSRSLRGIAEVGWDFEREEARITIGAMAAF